MPQPTDVTDWPLLERYLAGECSPSERQAFEAWLAGAPDRAAYVDDLRQSLTQWRAARAPKTEHALDEVLAITRRNIPKVISSARPVSHIRSWVFFGTALAAATIMALVGISYHPTQTFREFATARGGRSTIVLRDGTRLVLGPDTRLKVAADFGRGNREVTLDGEAYFSVVHDERHPFAVLTHNIKVTDVGTEFDVRGYDDEIRVAVARGSVVVGAGQGRRRSLRNDPPVSPIPHSFAAFDVRHPTDDTEASFWGRHGRVVPGRCAPGPCPAPTTTNDVAYLTAGDVAEATATGFTVTHHADIASATAWLQGGLAFQATPLPAVVRQLARTYDLDITIADSSLASEAITATFENEPADRVLDAVTRIIGARYERSGRQIVIRRQNTKTLDHGSNPPPLRTVEKTS